MSMRRIFVFLLGVCLAAPSAFAASVAQSEINRLYSDIFEMAAKSDFVAIQRKIDKDLASQARFSDGRWKISFAYSGVGAALERLGTNDAAWEALEKKLSAMVAEKPSASLLYVELLINRAWQIRGTTYASKVDSNAWGPFRKYMKQAAEVLDSNKQALAGNPAWYSLRIRVALESGEEKKKLDDIFDEAVKRHPDYHAIYFNKAQSLLPKWGGSESQMLDFLSRVAKLKGKTLEEGMYLRIVWYVEPEGMHLILSPRLDAQAMRIGSENIFSRYPDQLNVQQLFFMACERSDKPLTAKMLTKVSDPPLISVWGKSVGLFEMCSDWARGKIPMFIMRAHEGDSLTEHAIQ